VFFPYDLDPFRSILGHQRITMHSKPYTSHSATTLFFLCLMWALGSPAAARAQEFPKGFVGYLEFHQGLSTAFQGLPDLFVGELQFRPQYTVIADQLRLGATAGLIYTDTHVDGLIGPSIALKIATLSIPEFGSVANIQLQADYDWTTRDRQLLGGGPKVELGQIGMIGFTVHRDLQDNAWLFQTTIGYNLFHKKRPPGPPPDPLHQNK
jgi:hypothetical protein